MRTSEDSLREQAARFFAMAEVARAEGNLGLAELLIEAGRRATVGEASSPPTVPLETDIAERQARREDLTADTDASADRLR